MRPDILYYEGTAVTVDVAIKLEVPRILLVVNKIPQVFDLDDVRNKVEELYDCKVAALLPHSDDMMALASKGIFSVEYPDHPVALGYKSIVAQILTR
jgi:MinD-like ATPase involved in chromosome partitioning or flagellar assembly